MKTEDGLTRYLDSIYFEYVRLMNAPSLRVVQRVPTAGLISRPLATGRQLFLFVVKSHFAGGSLMR